ncbi:MAG: hypothetical protein Q8K36_02615 [Alphaproteobacteria bacterium]|nr:hypothetical protein [Alphaproteobacteria bacterium]
MKQFKKTYLVFALLISLTGKYYGAAEVRAAAAFPQSPFTTKCTARNAIVNWDIVKDVMMMAGGVDAIIAKISDRLLPCMNDQNKNFTNNFLDHCRKDAAKVNEIDARAALCRGEKNRDVIIERLRTQANNMASQAAPAAVPQTPEPVTGAVQGIPLQDNNKELLTRIEALEQQIAGLSKKTDDISAFIMGPLKDAFHVLMNKAGA